MKRVMKFGTMIGGKSDVFTLDMTAHLDEHGVLTDAGRDALRVELISKMRAQYPGALLERIESAAEGCLPPPGLTLPQLKIAMHIRTITLSIERASALLQPLRTQIMDLAQDIDAECGTPGPHVFSAGGASAHLAAGLALLQQASDTVENILAHKDDFTGGSEPPN